MLLKRTCIALAMLSLAGCGKKGALANPGPDQAVVPAIPLYTVPLAGEKVTVLPLSLILAERPLSTEAPFTDRIGALRWCDSLLAYALENRAPDVSWVLPAELRRIARRAPGVAPDPDRMGQSVMGAPKLDFMPDPLRSYARSMVALAGGRMLLIPAAASFTPVAAGIRTDFSIVMADARNGRVIWRSLAVGQGATAEAAMEAALKTMLPLPTDGQ
ncbi:MAG: hypothetical protein ABI613_11565 [Gemmatimonadota bacterium]